MQVWIISMLKVSHNFLSYLLVINPWIWLKPPMCACCTSNISSNTNLCIQQTSPVSHKESVHWFFLKFILRILRLRVLWHLTIEASLNEQLCILNRLKNMTDTFPLRQSQHTTTSFSMNQYAKCEISRRSLIKFA